MKRPLKFKLNAYHNWYHGMTPLEAFAMASSQNDDIPLSGCMTTKAYASSYMSDDIRNFLRKKLDVDNKEVIEYLRVNGLPALIK